MSDFNRVAPYLEIYLKRWMDSPTAKRIVDVEELAIVSGRADHWKGVTVPDFILGILQEYTLLLRQHPELLKSSQEAELEQAVFQERLKGFLTEEQDLIDKADHLTQLVESYKLGRFDPRWHKAQSELTETVKQFRLTDEKYQLNLGELPNIKN